MDTGAYALFSSLLAGSVRAVLLWRASVGVEVVNVVVLRALVEGRGKDIDVVLRRSGSAAYLGVASAIGRSALGLHAESQIDDEARAQPRTEDRAATAHDRAPRQRLQRAAQAAIIVAGQRLRRHAWLDSVALAALAYAGIEAAVSASATPFKTVGLVAATLLWVANVRSVRSIATRIYLGANALIDSVLASMDELPSFVTGQESDWVPP